MASKIYEGENIQELVERAKRELGENIKIVQYEIFKEKKWFFLGRRKYRILVEAEEKEEKQPQIDFEELLKKVESLVEEKVKEVAPAVNSQPQKPNLPPHLEDSIPVDVKISHEFTGEAVELINRLIKNGVYQDVAEDIVKEACGLDLDTNKWDLNAVTLKEALTKGIEGKISFTGALDEMDNIPKVIAFLGPTGVGKTTNLFKIASQFVLNKKKKVSVISIDTFKVGAVHQGRIYANILNVPFYPISEAKKLRNIVDVLGEDDIVLIDTVGRSHYDYWRLGEIKEILSGVLEELFAVLVVSCNYKDEDAFDVVENYQNYFKIDALLMTKIDETKKPGLLLNLPYKTEIPLSYISTGQRVPEDIKVLSPEVVSSYFLKG
jgi:flagellar biosynthesis protein FlhF